LIKVKVVAIPSVVVTDGDSNTGLAAATKRKMVQNQIIRMYFLTDKPTLTGRHHLVKAGHQPVIEAQYRASWYAPPPKGSWSGTRSSECTFSQTSQHISREIHQVKVGQPVREVQH